MKNYIFFTIFILSAIVRVQAQQTYFISTQGNDSATGLSQSDAWKSIEKVNSVTFQPGDKVLFKKGETWYGQLKMKGSGTAEKPILLSSYGNGTARPVINIGEAEGAGILLHDVSFWEVDGMEVTSGAAPKPGIGRQGIVAKASGVGVDMEHIVVRNCYVHDIWGQMGGNSEYSGYNSCAILVHMQFNRNMAVDPSAKRSTINDILIENNRIERFDKCGIICRGARNNVVVRKNYIANTGGDGIFVNGPYRGLIEFNEVHESCVRSGHPDLPESKGWWPHTAAIWIQNTEETIMQFNEVYDTGRELLNGDGFAYDFDFNCKRCIAQYNYSRNNHGLMLLMYNIFENVTRYNISENDKTHLVQVQGPLSDRNILYNNVFYLDRNTGDFDFFCGNDNDILPENLGAVFHNNIFYATGQGRFRTVYSHGATETRIYEEEVKAKLPSGALFKHNCYFGPWKNGLPDDPEALVADPQFVAPGTGGIGLNTLLGYQLKDGSPCINAGMFIPNQGGRDFFGNVVNDGKPDMGAFEKIGSGVFADRQSEEALTRTANIVSELAWSRWSFPSEIEVPENASEVVIRLREPLAKAVDGSITWTNPTTGKETIYPLSKQKNRAALSLPLKADKATILASKVKVKLTEGGYEEEVTIPFIEPRPRRR